MMSTIRAMASRAVPRLSALAGGIPLLALAVLVVAAPAAAQPATTAPVKVYHSTDTSGAAPGPSLPPGCEGVGGGGGPTIWTTHGDGTRIGTIDPNTGNGSDIGATGQTSGWAAAFDLDGTLYTTYNGFSGNPQLATVDQTTGAILSTIGGLGTNLIALEFDALGQLWGVGYDDRRLYKIDKTTGATTEIGDTGISSTMDLAFDSSGTLYSTTSNVLYSLDLTTGAPSVEANLTGIISGSVMGIMFDASETLFATAYVSNSPLYTLDVATGAATVVGSTTFNSPHGGDILGGSGGLDCALTGSEDDVIQLWVDGGDYNGVGSLCRMGSGGGVGDQVCGADILLEVTSGSGRFTQIGTLDETLVHNPDCIEGEGCFLPSATTQLRMNFRRGEGGPPLGPRHIANVHMNTGGSTEETPTVVKMRNFIAAGASLQERPLATVAGGEGDAEILAKGPVSIPEPGRLLMLASGLVGLFGLHRLRQRRQDS